MARYRCWTAGGGRGIPVGGAVDMSPGRRIEVGRGPKLIYLRWYEGDEMLKSSMLAESALPAVAEQIRHEGWGRVALHAWGEAVGVADRLRGLIDAEK